MADILPAALLGAFVSVAWWFGVLQPPGKERDVRTLLALLAATTLVILGGIALAELRR